MLAQCLFVLSVTSQVCLVHYRNRHQIDAKQAPHLAHRWSVDFQVRDDSVTASSFASHNSYCGPIGARNNLPDASPSSRRGSQKGDVGGAVSRRIWAGFFLRPGGMLAFDAAA